MPLVAIAAHAHAAGERDPVALLDDVGRLVRRGVEYPRDFWIPARL